MSRPRGAASCIFTCLHFSFHRCSCDLRHVCLSSASQRKNVFAADWTWDLTTCLLYPVDLLISVSSVDCMSGEFSSLICTPVHFWNYRCSNMTLVNDILVGACLPVHGWLIVLKSIILLLCTKFYCSHAYRQYLYTAHCCYNNEIHWVGSDNLKRALPSEECV